MAFNPCLARIRRQAVVLNAPAGKGILRGFQKPISRDYGIGSEIYLPHKSFCGEGRSCALDRWSRVPRAPMQLQQCGGRACNCRAYGA